MNDIHIYTHTDNGKVVHGGYMKEEGAEIENTIIACINGIADVRTNDYVNCSGCDVMRKG